MRVKFSYPLKTSLVLTEHWPVTVGNVTVEWTVEGGLVSAICATMPVTDQSALPTVNPSAAPGVSFDISIGAITQQEIAEEAVRTVWGILGLFASIEVDLQAVKTSWLPDTDAEREQLKLFSFSYNSTKPDLFAPRRLGYDLVARAMLCARSAAHFEIPLSFLRRGNQAIYDDQYIEAFYYLFFFLETLFSPGYSNPRRVRETLWAASAVRKAVSQCRASFSKDSSVDPGRRDELLAMTDEHIVHHLVSVRGKLHHHALRRPGVWHPERPHAFREEAFLLQSIVHSIAMTEVMAAMFDPERDEDLMKAAEAVGAVNRVRVEVFARVNGERLMLQPFIVVVPCRTVDHAAIDAVNRFWRQQFGDVLEDPNVVEYRIASEEGSKLYAEWQRATAAPPLPTTRDTG